MIPKQSFGKPRRKTTFTSSPSVLDNKQEFLLCRANKSVIVAPSLHDGATVIVWCGGMHPDRAGLTCTIDAQPLVIALLPASCEVPGRNGHAYS